MAIFDAPPLVAGLLGQDEAERLKKQAIGTGLLSAVIGGLSAAPQYRYGGIAPILGQALQAGMQGVQGTYTSALENFQTQQKIDEMRRQEEQRRLREQAISNLPTEQQAIARIDPNSLGTLLAAQAKKPESPFGKIDPKDYTPDSIRAFMVSGNVGDLMPREPKEKSFKIGDTRDFVQGTQRVTQEYQPDGTWKTIATGAAFAPPSQVNVNMPTESERTAGFLTSRLQGGLQQLRQAVGEKPAAAAPTLGAEAVKFVTGSDYLKNLVNPETRQRVEAAQLEILDAALTLGTGAAYTREQLQNYQKSYFPQLGDKPQTIAEKQKRLETLLQSARVKAGRAIPADVGLPPNVTVKRVQ